VEFLQVFLALQGLEGRRRALRDAIAAAPQKQTAEDQRFHREQAAYEEQSARKKDLELKRAELTDQSATLEQRIARDKERMQSIRNNVEYQALLREIDHAEHEKLEAGKKLAIIAREIETTDAALTQHQGGFETAKAAHDGNLATLADEVKRIEADLQRLEEERAAIAGGLAPEQVSLYEKLALSRGGVVVVPALAGGCGGCHIKLRPAIMSQLRRRAEMIRCDSCSRILYLPDAEPAKAG
jgi:predicted  nucleic acid-binding Zn-ribbon protein